MSQKIKQLIIKRSNHSLNKNGELTTEEAEIILQRTFDENNNKISEITFAGEEPEQEAFYVYKNNLCVEEKINHCLDGFSENATINYNSDNLISQQIKKYEYGNEITNFYYQGKNLIKKEVCDDDGTIENLTKISYLNDMVVLLEEYSPLDRLVLKRDITIENEVIIEEKQWSIENNKTLTIKYNSWQKDVEPSYSILNAEGKVLERTTRIYNDDKQLVEEIVETTSQGYQKYITKLEYDAHGNMICSETKNANDEIIKKIETLYNNTLPIKTTHIEVNKLIDNSIQHYTDFFEYDFFE
jgi:hypothetical protein